MNKIKWLTLFLVIVIVVTTGWYVQQREAQQSVSDTITKQAPQLGPLGHLLLPNLDDATVYAPDRPHDPFEVFSEDKHERITRIRKFSVSTNSMGFRGREFSPIKEQYRILCIGDSVTFGWGVEADEAYPALLAKELNVEVINAGVPALKPEHIVNYTKSIIHQTNPDLILLALRPNWMMPQPIEKYAQSITTITKEISTIPVGLILPPIASFDPMGRQRSDNEVSQIKRKLPSIPLLDLTPVFDQNMPQTGVSLRIADNQQQMIDRATGEVLVSAPLPKPGPGQPSLAPELIAMFEQNKSISEPLFFDGGHPDKEGFVVFTTAVSAWIRQQSWL